MKKSFLFIFTLMITFAWCNIFAQQGDEISAGRIPAGIKGESSIISHDPTPTDATVGYAYSTSNFQLRSLPLPGGTPLTNIGTSYTFTDFAGGGCFGGDGNFYVCTLGDVTGTPQIWTMNLSTGQPTLVGGTGTSAAEGFNGIAYDQLTDTYYGVSGTNLYTFNNSTGTATLVGPMNNTGGLAVDCAIDCDGNMYMHDLGLDNIYSVNKTTGNATLIGTTGFAANYGQGMGYDHDANVLYLMAFNATTFTAQLRTVDVATGMTTLVTDYGLDQQTAFDGQATCIPCPIGAATNPNPANGATGVSINLPQISWTNGAGATSIEVFFNGSSVYSGAPVTSYTIPGALNYSTTYNWKVNGTDGTCIKYGPTWSFTTAQDPNQVTVTVDIYPDNVNYWTGTCDASTKTQVSLVNGISTEVGWMAFNTTPIVNIPSTVIESIVFNGYLYANNWPYWSITPMGAVNPITGTASEISAVINAGYTQGTAYSFNQEAGTMTNGWLQRNLTDGGATTNLKNALGQGWFAIGVVDWDFSTSYYVEFQGWNEANKPYLTVTYHYSVPVELTSFTASANFGVVDLQWITATETNNQGFEVQRSNGSDFETIAFVDGFGTTTETQVYTYSDRSVEVGTYSYRLKQVDFDGTFDYSDVVEVNVPAPSVFALEQNYPNPFNPSTKINFQLKVDSKVSLKVFDILGQEVATLINTNLVAGAHNVNFDASKLNSGVYLYRIEATGIDGSNFIDVKKMILTK